MLFSFGMEKEHFLKLFKQQFTRTLDLRRTFLILMLICALCFMTFNHLIRKDYELGISEVIYLVNHSGLILDTEGCRIPKFDPFHKSVKHLIKIKEPYTCSGEPLFLFSQNNTIFLNETIVKTSYKVSPQNVFCSYRAIFREHEPTDGIGENYISYSELKKLKFGVYLKEEFIKVECSMTDKSFTHFIPLVPLKPDVEERASKTKVNSSDELNVILIGIDSVSKLNFLRHFKRTRNFLKRNLSAFSMKGYTKVADNTFPNLVPLLTGHFIEHYWNESQRKMFFDHLDLIWKDYAKNGYTTFYAEDSPYTGTFNYLKRGFKNQPTDYYFRPLALAVEDSGIKKKSSPYCLNSELEIDLIYGYLRDFTRLMEHRPYFAFAMVSTMTHDYLNDASYADEPTYRFLKQLWETGVMNRSLVVFFSDHGIRFGSIRETYIGKYEERMPFMYLIIPQWFLDKNEYIGNNLRENQNRLITAFDIHATFYHLLVITKDLSEEEKSRITPNGLSVMGKIPQYRTCEMAKILPHWCPCQIYQYIPKTDKIANRTAFAIMDKINKQLQPFKDRCAHLEVDEVTDARFRQANDMILRFVRHKNTVIDRHIVYGDKVVALTDFLVTVKVRPGGGMFEGTVRYDAKNENLTVLGISRINKYGKQSICIDNQILQKFCYCMPT